MAAVGAASRAVVGAGPAARGRGAPAVQSSAALAAARVGRRGGQRENDRLPRAGSRVDGADEVELAQDLVAAGDARVEQDAAARAG